MNQDEEKFIRGIELVVNALADILEEDLKRMRELEDYFHGRKEDG